MFIEGKHFDADKIVPILKQGIEVEKLLLAAMKENEKDLVKLAPHEINITEAEILLSYLRRGSKASTPSHI